MSDFFPNLPDDATISAAQAIAQQLLPKGQKERKAITKITKTPITFTQSSDPSTPAADGNYYYATPIGKLLSHIFTRPPFPSQLPHITMNPYSGYYPEEILHHEQVHALLDPDPIDITKVTGYSDIAKAIAGKMGEEYGSTPQNEVPAYAVEPHGIVPLQMKDVFTKDFVNQLQQKDPQKAALYQQLLSNYSDIGIQ